MDWEVPKMWEGGECWIIGGGPSMPRLFGVPEEIIEAVKNRQQPMSAYSPYLSAIHDRHVIGVNAAFLLGDWVDVMVFGDGPFYVKNKDDINKFKKIKVSVNPSVEPGKKGVFYIKHLTRDGGHPYGISTRPGMVSWNKHTGGAAINLAYHFGVKRVLLLGFDMKNDTDGSSHWHGQYRLPGKPGEKQRMPFDKHLQSFRPIANDAKRYGLEILNVNPDSAIRELPKVKLEDVL